MNKNNPFVSDEIAKMDEKLEEKKNKKHKPTFWAVETNSKHFCNLYEKV